MTLDPDTIRLGYRLILDRAPGAAEVEAGQTAFQSLQAMRQAFLKSREFRRKFTRIADTADAAQTPALVQLITPGSTVAHPLRDQLLTLGGLQPALELDDTGHETLRQLPPGEQRALRYVQGDLSYGAGAGLEGPHRYLVTLADPGPRLHALWRLWGAERSFGAFLETALDDLALRLEVDNGQVRRLSGYRGSDGIGEERSLLQHALHNALGPEMIIGFDDVPDALVSALNNSALFEGEALPRIAPVAPPPDYAQDLSALSAGQKQLFDGYTVWDSYCYSVCRQLLLSNPI